MLLVNQLVGFGAGGGGPITVTRTAQVQGVSGVSNVATISSVSIGTASSDRTVVLMVAATEGVDNTYQFVSATIDYGSGDVSMNAGTQATRYGSRAMMFYQTAPSGTTATIKITYTTTGGQIASTYWAIAVYSITNAAFVSEGANTSADTIATPLTTGSITIPQGGAFLAVVGVRSSSSRTWTNATEDVEVSDIGTATRTTDGTVTVTCSTVASDSGSLAYMIFQQAS